MSILFWNCRGLGNPTTIQVLVDLIHTKRPKLVFLMETLANHNKMQFIRIRLGFYGLFTVDCIGHSGGLALLWKEESNVTIMGYSRNHIDASVVLEEGANTWRFTGYYGNPERSRRRESWQLIKHLATLSSLPWALMGDFNDILSSNEKRGRHPQPQWLINGFRDAVECSGLRELPFEGYQYTWERSRDTLDWVEEKLDRILVSDSWVDLFGEARASSIIASSSDHLPIVLWPYPSIRFKGRRRFEFENSWIKEGECRDIVNRSWNLSRGFNLASRVDLCGKAIWEWGRKRTVHFKPKIDYYKHQMEQFHHKKDNYGVQAYAEAQRQCLYWMDQQNSYWK